MGSEKKKEGLNWEQEYALDLEVNNKHRERKTWEKKGNYIVAETEVVNVSKIALPIGETLSTVRAVNLATAPRCEDASPL
jgi:hypothetical protein